MSVDGGEGTRVLESSNSGNLWIVNKEGICFFSFPDKQGRSDLSLYEITTGKIRKILTVEKSLGMGACISPDDRSILFSQFDEFGSDLMLVENFR